MVTLPRHELPLAPGTSDAGGAALPAGVWREADDQLNYRRFFAVNTLAAIRVEDPEVFDALPRRDPPLVRRGRWSTACASTTPTACATPAATSTTSRELTGGAYVLVEKILEPGEQLRAVLGHGRHHRLRRPGPRRPRAHRPGRPGARSTPSRPRCAAAAGRLARRWSTTASARSPTASCTPRSAGSPASCARRATDGSTGRTTPSPTPSPSCWPASAVYRSYLPAGPRAPRRRARRGPARAVPTSPTRSTSSGPLLGRPRAPGRAALPADQRHGDGQGRRGLLVLPLLAPDLAQRGRRRPVAVLAVGRPPSTPPWPSASATGRTR